VVQVSSASTTGIAKIQCPSNYVATGGGAVTQEHTATTPHLYISAPIDSSGNLNVSGGTPTGWEVAQQETGAGNGVTAYVVCSK
jgi:hypothetical protein